MICILHKLGNSNMVLGSLGLFQLARDTVMSAFEVIPAKKGGNSSETYKLCPASRILQRGNSYRKSFLPNK